MTVNANAGQITELWQVDDHGNLTNLSRLWADQGRFVGPIDDFDNDEAFGLTATWIQSGNDVYYSSGGAFSSSLTAGFTGPITNLEMMTFDEATFTSDGELWKLTSSGGLFNVSAFYRDHGHFSGRIDDFDSDEEFGRSRLWIQSGNDIHVTALGTISPSLTSGFSGEISNMEMKSDEEVWFTSDGELWVLKTNGDLFNASKFYRDHGHFFDPIDDFDIDEVFGTNRLWLLSGSDIYVAGPWPLAVSRTPGLAGQVSNLEMVSYDTAWFTLTTVVPLPSAAWLGFGLLGLLGAARWFRKRGLPA